jgi:hypothetical protein
MISNVTEVKHLLVIHCGMPENVSFSKTHIIIIRNNQRYLFRTCDFEKEKNVLYRFIISLDLLNIRSCY